jgi:outer membrane protein
MDKTKVELRKRIEQAYTTPQAPKADGMPPKNQSQPVVKPTVSRKKNMRAAVPIPMSCSSPKQPYTVLGEEAQAKYEYAFRLKILELLKD